MGEAFKHPQAIVETADIGSGTRIWAFAHVMSGVSIGKDCNIGDHAFIESGVQIGNGVTLKNGVMVWKGVEISDYVFVGPGVVFTNDLYPRSPRLATVRDRYVKENNWICSTVVEEGVSIGANATIVCNVRLGRYCTVAAGSVVTRDVPPFHLVAGNPARNKGMVDHSGCVLRKQGDVWINPFTRKMFRFAENDLVVVPESSSGGKDECSVG